MSKNRRIAWPGDGSRHGEEAGAQPWQLLNEPTQEQRDQSDGRKAKIIKNLPADAYKVKVADGSIRFFSGKGLEKDK